MFIRQTTYGATGQATQKMSMLVPGHVVPSGVGVPSGSRVWSYGGRPVPTAAAGEIGDIIRDVARLADAGGHDISGAGAVCLFCRTQPPEGTSRQICPNQTPGGAPGPICTNWGPWALPGLSSHIGHQGHLGQYSQITSVTRG